MNDKFLVGCNDVEIPLASGLDKALVWDNFFDIVHIPNKLASLVIDFPVSFFAYGHESILRDTFLRDHLTLRL